MAAKSSPQLPNDGLFFTEPYVNDDYSSAYLPDPYSLDMFPTATDYTYTTSPGDDLLSISIPQSSPSSAEHISPRTADFSENELPSPELDELDFSLLDEWQMPQDPTTTGSKRGPSSLDPLKRTRGNKDDDDDLLACWKSPLCPSQREDGGRPENCNAECAPFLFATPSLNDEPLIPIKSEPFTSVESSASIQRKHKRTDDAPPQRTSSNSSSARTTPSSQPQELLESSESPKPTSKRAPAKPKGRVPHNEVEKKYRENVNSQLDALRRVVPVQNGLGGFDRVDIEDLPARQPSKAAVMSAATSYIKHLQRENDRIEKELAEAKVRNQALQRLAKCDDCSLMKYIMKLKLGPQAQ